MATKNWVADRVIEWLRNEGEVAPSELRRRLVEKYHVALPYHRVRRGKEIAMSIIHGCWDNSYSKMMAFKEELVRRNHGTMVKIDRIQQHDGWHFRRIFISIGACSVGFLIGCRPFLGLDGCHLKGKYKGVMLAATSIDGANRLFPVAYGIVESENIESWTWFLSALYEAIGMPNGLVLASNRQKRLEEAISKIYPLAEYRTCVRHLYKNFKKKFAGNILQKIVWSAANAFTTTSYISSLESLKTINMRAYEWFLDLEKRREIWSRSQFGTIAKCHYITNNISESFNAWVADPRHRPVLDLLDTVRQKIMEMMDKRRTLAARWKRKVVPFVVKNVKESSMCLTEYHVRRSTDYKAEVSYKDKRCEVVLNERKCTCRRWQVSGIPCMHALAFIHSIRGAKWEDYVDDYFSVDKYKATYQMEVAPMPDINEWVITGDGESLLPPISRRPAGRPRKNRIKDFDEVKKGRHKCKRCGSFGNHAKKCKEPEKESDPSMQSMTSSSSVQQAYR
ncbi:uncharacterized protein LOC120268648 [Dioscorea cayenensis subsp. rotundata]|uniref:Uncharacterized protein LOC120268648 n=1 Tax=Dioscorea cayennensis subsp. rotundata TaxID=55577 RepID=A0AB40BWP7_DIOCR|nr:uncharacterized protein LOC120268648 [Dioscorea cayenensis subsp. rotundata]